MKLSFFDKYGTSFNFIFQFYNKFQLLNSQRYCGNILKVWWEMTHRFCCKFQSLSSGKRILKISRDLTKLLP